jgi:uncharacterized cupin superfamily protein
MEDTRATWNVLNGDLDLEHERDGHRWRAAQVRQRIGGDKLGASVYELAPGQKLWPYHYHHGNEEWLLVLAGRPTLRAPEGEGELRDGDVVCFPDGPAGAHTLTNATDEPARFLILSTRVSPSLVVYPDSDKIGTRTSVDEGDNLNLPRGAALDYWDGE